ncbi:hypothetical protein VNO80_05124 [Phaseolus coccineus]|uniref:Uncharacterized protein n=1 Tax=Phaseolus coccineus TaxID=3886 RepID=A0AAN9NW34_PHACN
MSLYSYKLWPVDVRQFIQYDYKLWPVDDSFSGELCDDGISKQFLTRMNDSNITSRGEVIITIAKERNEKYLGFGVLEDYQEIDCNCSCRQKRREEKRKEK